MIRVRTSAPVFYPELERARELLSAIATACTLGTVRRTSWRTAAYATLDGIIERPTWTEELTFLDVHDYLAWEAEMEKDTPARRALVGLLYLAGPLPHEFKVSGHEVLDTLKRPELEMAA